MMFWMKKLWETASEIHIGYSLETNKTCDGIIVYDKKTKQLRIEKLSKGADEFDSKFIYQHIYGYLMEGGIPEKVTQIVTG